MKRFIVMFVGVLLLLIGTVAPGGTFIMASGTMMLICSSPWFRQCLQFFRGRFRWFNRMMTWMENKMPKKVGGVLKLTTPGYVPKPGDHGTEANL